MKIVYLTGALALLVLFGSCSKEHKAETETVDTLKPDSIAQARNYEYFGDSITSFTGAISTVELESKMKGTSKVEALVVGEITGSCQNKGCWGTLKIADGKDLTVRFKDYGFFLPVKNLEGKELVIKGEAKWDTTTVEALKEEAKEEGKSKKEIDAIKEPIYNLAFVASGVALKK